MKSKRASYVLNYQLGTFDIIMRLIKVARNIQRRLNEFTLYYDFQWVNIFLNRMSLNDTSHLSCLLQLRFNCV